MKRCNIAQSTLLNCVFCAFALSFVHCREPQPPSGKDNKNVGNPTYSDSVMEQKMKEKKAVPAQLDSLRIGKTTEQSATE